MNVLFYYFLYEDILAEVYTRKSIGQTQRIYPISSSWVKEHDLTVRPVISCPTAWSSSWFS